MNKFPENLKMAMKINSINQKELAKELETTQQTISRWLNGINEPDIETIIKICLLLNETPNSITGFDEITYTKTQKNIQNSFNNNSGNINFKG